MPIQNYAETQDKRERKFRTSLTTFRASLISVAFSSEPDGGCRHVAVRINIFTMLNDNRQPRAWTGQPAEAGREFEAMVVI